MAEKINLIGNEGFHIHAPVNSTTNGFMIKTDKAKLDDSTAAKTPSTLMKRDSNGQSKVSAPSDPEHIARKQDVDNLIITTGKIAPGAVTPNEMSASSLNAANHTYSGSVESASNVKQAIDLTKQRVDNIVAGAGASNTEILDARQPATGPAFPILRDRLNNTDAQLAEKTMDIINVKSLGIISGDNSATVKASNASILKNHIENNAVVNYYFPPEVFYFNEVRITKSGIKEVYLSGETKLLFTNTSLQSKIMTEGDNFLVRDNNTDVDFKFTITGLSLYSVDQSGKCFSSVNTYETAFKFKNVLMAYFDYGFFAPQYSSSCFGDNISLYSNHHGVYSTLESHYSIINKVVINFNVIGLYLTGFQTYIRNVHYGVGYVGADAASFSEYIGIFTQLGTTIDGFYAESYGQDPSKAVFFKIDFPGFDAVLVKINNASFPGGGDTAGAKHVKITNARSPYGTLAFPNNKTVLEITSSHVEGMNLHTGGTTLVRGISINGVNYFKNSNFAVFNNEELFVNAATTTKGIDNTSSGLTITHMQFLSTDIQDYVLFKNNTDTTSTGMLFDPSLGTIRFLSPGKYSIKYKIEGKVTADGTYTLGYRYRNSAGTYEVKRLKKIVTSNLSLADNGEIEVDTNGQSGFLFGFIKNDGAMIADADFGTLAIKLHLKQIG